MDDLNLSKSLTESAITNSKIVLVLVGGIIGFLSAVFKDFLLEGKKEKNQQKNLKREKLEEAFILLNELFTKSMVPIKYQKTNKNPAQLSMIIRFYFPKIEKDFQKFIAIYTKVAESHMKNINEQDFYTPDNFEEFRVEYQKFSNKLIEESKKLI